MFYLLKFVLFDKYPFNHIVLHFIHEKTFFLVYKVKNVKIRMFYFIFIYLFFLFIYIDTNSSRLKVPGHY